MSNSEYNSKPSELPGLYTENRKSRCWERKTSFPESTLEALVHNFDHSGDLRKLLSLLANRSQTAGFQDWGDIFFNFFCYHHLNLSLFASLYRAAACTHFSRPKTCIARKFSEKVRINIALRKLQSGEAWILCVATLVGTPDMWLYVWSPDCLPICDIFVTTNQYFLNKRANLMGSSTEHILIP